ncbi:phosphonates transport ATP-binding protein [Renibacterium salmoninarum ATCC 33209]|uniref:Phosphonates transport ATP-binding protein n=1 Tax=Renibacterium salmoninarum (strain ATCC 33209 / DSM 20767 / JCM 11484 / NBRC 15589 / NCIMB 2235) TaxID=288705 RepID=A9WLW7_RENSM|nr:phosphonate ABC transporter ATP-binding protein [Renibacterium salmoninarum]ABY22148.1 phosphonates transport ATP-binding protein [Renibacterium salmoninarum ATCC 33209]
MANSPANIHDEAISVAQLSKSFGELQALHDVNLSIPAGQIVVLLGLSGSGKSTLLRHLNQLELPSNGEVRVLGERVDQLRGKSLRQLRSRVGVIFQQFELVPSLSVMENVLTGALARMAGPRLGLISYPKSLRAKALDHLERVGLGAKAFQRADTLSGGQQQRVAIARALMQDPEILLADEPVVSLDPESSQQVMNLIREIGMERKLTVVCSLHQVELALSWGDRIIGLRAGSVVLDTPTEGLGKEQVMEIYGQVATSTAEIRAVQEELAEAAEQLSAGAAAAASQRKIND